MASDLVTVIWNGPYPAELPTGQLVQPGQEMQVGRHELGSSYYKEVKAPSKSRHADKQGSED